MVQNQTLKWGSLSRTPGIPEMLLLLVQKTMVGKLTYNSEIQGSIHTTMPSLLTFHPIKELHVNCKKEAYIHHKEIKAAQGIKNTSLNLEQASTLGSLDTFLEFLKTPTVNITVSGTGIGHAYKKDVMMEKGKADATILALM